MTAILFLTLVGGIVCDDSPAAAPGGLEIVSLARVTSTGENVKPFVVARPSGGAYLAWAQKRDENTAVLFARAQDGEHFDEPVRLSPEGMDLDLGAENGPNVAVDSRGNIYVVWAAGSRAASKAKPLGNTAKPNPSSGHADHAKHSGKSGMAPRPGNLNIYLATSTNDGRTFSKPIKVNDDPDGPEHRFPTVSVARDAAGTVYVAWLDKRKSTPEKTNFCRVFLAKSTDGGKTFAANIDVTDGQASSICHCCLVALAVQPARGVFVAYRNDIDDLRDMFLVRSKLGDAPYSKPVAMEDTGWYVPT